MEDCTQIFSAVSETHESALFPSLLLLFGGTKERDNYKGKATVDFEC